VAHVEALSHLLNAEDADVKRQFSVDVFGRLLEVDGFIGAIDDVPVVELQTGRYAIAQGVHLLVRPARSRPFDTSQVLHVRF
jgi:hypothetical protein